MSYQIGDTVDVLHEFADAAGDLVQRDRYIISKEMQGWYVIRPVADSGHSGHIVSQYDLELCTEVLLLPIGDQPELSKPQNLCDCGGYKVYGGMDSTMHSPWCSSVKK